MPTPEIVPLPADPCVRAFLAMRTLTPILSACTDPFFPFVLTTRDPAATSHAVFEKWRRL